MEYPTQNNFKATQLSFKLLPILLLLIFEALMTYIFPIVTEDRLKSAMMVGVIMSLASFIGLLGDFLFPQVFQKRSSKFYVLLALIAAPFYASFTYLAARFDTLIFFGLAGIFWGLYFEAMIFAVPKTIVETQSRLNYSQAWGFYYTFNSIVTIICPIIAAYWLDRNIVTAALYTLPISLFALLIFFLINSKPKRHVEQLEIFSDIHIKVELKIWILLLRAILPVFIACIFLAFYDAVYSTYAGLFGKELFGDNPSIEWAIFLSYVVPTLLGSIFVARFKKSQGKKRLSNLSIFAGGMILSLLLFVNSSQILILLIIIFSSLALSIALPYNDAVFSDFSLRLGKKQIHLIALSRLANSIGYIIAPVVFGFVAQELGYKSMFAIFGFLTSLTGLLLLLITPTKIKMPQGKLEEFTQLLEEDKVLVTPPDKI